MAGHGSLVLKDCTGFVAPTRFEACSGQFGLNKKHPKMTRKHDMFGENRQVDTSSKHDSTYT